MTSPTAPSSTRPIPGPVADRRLRRRDGRLGGVCAGIGQAFDIDPKLIRIITVVLALGGVGFFAYAAAWMLLPRAGDTHPDRFRLVDNGPRLWIGLLLAFIVVSSSFPVAAFGGSSWLVALGTIGAGFWLLNREPDATRSELSSFPPPSGPAAFPAPSATTPTAHQPTAESAADPEEDDEDPLLREARLLDDPFHDTPLVAEAYPMAPSSGTTWGTTWLEDDDVERTSPLKTRRPPVTSVTLAIAALAIGALMALDAIGWVTVGAVAYAVTVAAVLGIGMIASFFIGRALPLIPLFLLSLFAVPVAAALGSGFEDGVGEQIHVVTAEADLADRYALGVGSLVVDLGGLELTEDHTVEIDLTMGGLEVIVPADARVDVRTDPMLGGIDIQLDEVDGGSGDEGASTTRSDEVADEPVLTLVVDIELGGGEIVRADS